MQRLDWWIGVGFVAIALFAHAMLRRYEVLKPEPRDLRAFQIRRSGSAICAWGWRSGSRPWPRRSESAWRSRRSRGTQTSAIQGFSAHILTRSSILLNASSSVSPEVSNL